MARARAYAVSVAVLTPDALHALARASPGLQSLTVVRLSSEFSTGEFSLTAPASQPRKSSRRAAPKSVSDDSITGHALQELCLYNPWNAPQANVSKLARFLHELFPQLQVERCIGKGHLFTDSPSWTNVLQEL